MLKHFADRHQWELRAKQANYDFTRFTRSAPVCLRQLERIFPELFGLSPQRWLLCHKLKQARLLLAQGRSNKCIVADLHFASDSYFCREFKRLFGISPQRSLNSPAKPNVVPRQ
jgi:AraC-like DNA-binding protein